MFRHLERLLQIDALLRTGKRQTAISLAEALEISERTIRNDLAFLRDHYHASMEFSREKVTTILTRHGDYQVFPSARGSCLP